MDRRSYLAGVGAIGTGSLAGCLDVLAGDEFDIGMEPEEYVPREYTATVGSTVVWKNTSSRGHTVTAVESRIPEAAEYFASGGFETEQRAREEWDTTGEDGMMYTGETFEHTFEIPGRYDYVCLPHLESDMVGTVIVEEE